MGCFFGICEEELKTDDGELRTEIEDRRRKTDIFRKPNYSCGEDGRKFLTKGMMVVAIVPQMRFSKNKIRTIPLTV